MRAAKGGWEVDWSERPSIWVHCWWSVSALLSCTAPCHRHWLARETLVSLLTANWLPFTSCSTALLIRSKSTTGNSVSACHYHWPNNGSWHEGRNKQTKRTTICLYGTHWMLDKSSHRERIFRHGYACGDQRQELNHLSNYVNGEIGEESNVQCSHATSCAFEGGLSTILLPSGTVPRTNTFPRLLIDHQSRLPLCAHRASIKLPSIAINAYSTN